MNSVTANTDVQRGLGITVLLTIMWIVAMGVELKQFGKSRNACELKSPVAALELADSPGTFRAVLDQGNQANNVKVMMWNTGMDFVFIALYCLTFWLLANAYITESILPRLIKIAIVVTGAFDILEDIQLWRELGMVSDLTPETVSLTRGISLTKWAAFALALALLAVYYWLLSGSSTLLKSISVSAGAAAALTAIGLFNNSMINLMSLPMGLVFLFTAIKFFPFQHAG